MLISFRELLVTLRCRACWKPFKHSGSFQQPVLLHCLQHSCGLNVLLYSPHRVECNMFFTHGERVLSQVLCYFLLTFIGDSVSSLLSPDYWECCGLHIVWKILNKYNNIADSNLNENTTRTNIAWIMYRKVCWNRFRSVSSPFFILYKTFEISSKLLCICH